MPNELFSITGERKKLPTLRMFLKSNGDRKLPQIFPVFTVWKPSQYGTIVFETERFRAIVYEGDSVYEQLSQNLENIVWESSGLGVSPDIDNPGRFSLVSLDREDPWVTTLGEYGWKLNYL